MVSAMRVTVALGVLLLTAPARAEEPDVSASASASSAPAHAEEADVPAPAAAAPAPAEPTFNGFQLGLRTGYARTLDSTQGASLTYGTPSLLPIAFDAGYRTSPKVYIGLTAQLALASRTDCGGASPCSAKEYRVGGGLQYHFTPFRTFDPWLGAGVGYEIVHLSGFLGDSGGHLTRTGFVLLDAQVGADFALTRGASMARGPKLGPFAGLALGARSSQSGRVYGIDVDQSSGSDHQWLMLGVRGTLDL
jgi:hypothetical protein